MEKMIKVVVSGYFDPLHVGHVRYLSDAACLGDWLIVIVNNDEQAKLKKGFSFMPEKERVEIMEALIMVDEVVLSIDKDESVRFTLGLLNPTIFAKGGDRTEDNIPEKAICKKLGIKIVSNVGGGKSQSSSALIQKVKEV